MAAASSHPDLDFHPGRSLADRRESVAEYVAALAELEECRARLDALPKSMRQRDPEKAAALAAFHHARRVTQSMRSVATAPPFTPEQIELLTRILRSVP